MGNLYAENPEPLADLADTYGHCLAMGRQYAAETISDDPEQEVDLDALEHFISARSELLAMAEANLNGLAGRPQSADQEPFRREMTDKVVAILEEMAEMETQLASFLHDRLSQMSQTINQMKKAQPVFKRYGYLGGPRAPSRITRHE